MRSLLAEHRDAAIDRGDFADTAVQMALLPSEGDNTSGGAGKRQLEGDHHHDAEPETAREEFESVASHLHATERATERSSCSAPWSPALPSAGCRRRGL